MKFSKVLSPFLIIFSFFLVVDGFFNMPRALAALPTFVACGAAADNAAAITPALPSGISTNDILLMFLETRGQVISVANQNGGTWAAVTNSPQNDPGNTGLSVFWSRYNGTQGAPTTSDSGDHQNGAICAYRGVITSGNPWDVTSASLDTTSDTSGSIPGATTTGSDRLVVIVGGADDDVDLPITTVTNSDLASISSARVTVFGLSGNDGGLSVFDGQKSTAGTYGITSLTYTGATRKGMMTIALTPAPPVYSQSSYYSESAYYAQSSYYAQSTYYAESAYYSQSSYGYSESAYYAQSSYYAQSTYYAESAYYSQSSYGYSESTYYSQSSYGYSESAYGAPPPQYFIYFQGKAFPDAKLTLLVRDDQGRAPVYNSTQNIDLQTSGAFSMELGSSSPQIWNYAIIAEDKLGVSTQSRFYEIDTSQLRTTIKDIFLPPTITLARTVVRKGDSIVASGYKFATSRIEASIDGIKKRVEVTYPEKGTYRFQVSTADLEVGAHVLRAWQEDTDSTKSDFSILKTFNVSALLVPAADLNNDNKVNISDWSIFVSSWHSTSEVIRLTIDMNGDDKTDISDFSIFLRSLRK